MPRDGRDRATCWLANSAAGRRRGDRPLAIACRPTYVGAANRRTAMPDTLTLADDLLAREAELRDVPGSCGCATPRPRSACPRRRCSRRGGRPARRAGWRGPTAPRASASVLARLPEAGEVMALTRNEACVHELVGRYDPPDDRGRDGPGGRRDRPPPLPAALGLRLRRSTRRPAPGRAAACSSSTAPAPRSTRSTPPPPPTAPASTASPTRAPTPTPRRRSSSPRRRRPGAARRRGRCRGPPRGLGGLAHTHEFFQLLRRFGVGPRPGDAPRRPRARPPGRRRRPHARC